MPEAIKGGHRTYWRHFGEGAQSALMFHCSLAHSGAFAGLAAQLGDLLSMTAFDLPGHGRSAPWQDTVPLQRLTVDMALDFLDQPMHLIGHSFGATAALRLACERPDLVRSLSLIEPVFFAVAYADDPTCKARHLSEMAEISDAIETGDRRTAARLFLRVWGDGRPWADLPLSQQRSMAAQIHLITAAHPEIGHDTAGLLASGALQQLDIPTLLIEGDQSPAIIDRINTGLMARLPHCQRAVVAGAAHMAPLSHPGAVAAEIRAFLQTLPAPGVEVTSP